ncbi:MAG: gamma-glutamyl-gamma-aminobutyrate hydrolase family protein [Clostridia bacterium]|nr:gamma-glutamyl-gamma-aminobutyrate hydrolase family protein [Clostridia bacterium]
MKPIIGVLAEIDNEFCTRVQNPYIHAIERCGGIPVLFPFIDEEETMDRLVDLCDGFFFTGGADIHPKHYGEVLESNIGGIQEHRDAFEFKCFEKVIKTSKPILGICRGAQLINVALGGTLYQDIPSEVSTKILHRQCEPKFSPSHDVRIIVRTPLYEMTGVEQIKANSFHHQAIKKLGKGLEIMGIAEDGLIEAVYSAEERYVRAYQWHPERLFETDPQNRRIFEDFIQACSQPFALQPPFSV